MGFPTSDLFGCCAQWLHEGAMVANMHVAALAMGQLDLRRAAPTLSNMGKHGSQGNAICRQVRQAAMSSRVLGVGMLPW